MNEVLSLPLARSAVDRDYLSRSNPDLFIQLAAQPTTRVLPIFGGKVLLTGAANDKVMLVESEWTDTGTVINQAGHNYAVYTGTSDPSAQLLIDQQMLQSHQTS